MNHMIGGISIRPPPLSVPGRGRGTGPGAAEEVAPSGKAADGTKRVTVRDRAGPAQIRNIVSIKPIKRLRLSS